MPPRHARASEKRRFPREIVHLSGVGELVSKWTGGDGKRLHETKGTGNKFPVSTADVSSCGLQIHFNADLVGGDFVRLIFAPNDPATRLVVEGYLVWVRKNAVDIFGRYTAGVRMRENDDKLPEKMVKAENALQQ
jgi:hypothetical protein